MGVDSDCCTALGIGLVAPRTDETKQEVNNVLVAAATFLLTAALMLALQTPADSLHGVRSSFLLGNIWEEKLSTPLLYLSDSWSNDERHHVINRLKANGDTHIDLYLRASEGHLPGGRVDANGDFLFRLRELRASGLEPVLWLIPESRHQDWKAPMAEHLSFIDASVQRYDKEASAYVVCLECDETFSPSEVTQMVRHLKSKTGKPVAVHLAPGVGGFKRDPSYYAEADYIYLQVGDHLTGDYVADRELALSMLREAMKLGLPVVANEYALYSEDPKARALGDELCAAGAVGTGNGRTVTMCGQQPKRESWTKRHKDELLIIGAGAIAIALGARVMMNNNQLGMRFNQVGVDYQSDRLLFTYRISF